MRIGSVSNAAFEQYKVNRIARTGTTKVPQATDQLETSETSRLFSQALQAAHSVPDVREARVDALREEIAAGTYTRNSREIAARILAGTQEP